MKVKSNMMLIGLILFLATKKEQPHYTAQEEEVMQEKIIMSQTLETTITKALEKTGANKESTLCTSLPSSEI